MRGRAGVEQALAGSFGAFRDPNRVEVLEREEVSVVKGAPRGAICSH